MSLTYGYATESDVDAFYSHRPRETLRAIAIRLNNEPVAIIGLAKEPDRDRAFSEFKPELCPYLKSMTVLRAIKAFMRWVEDSRVPVYALSEGTGLLERLGFQPVSGDVFMWVHKE